MQTLSVFVCTTEEQRRIEYIQNETTSEDICIKLCKDLNIKPSCFLLFALRIYNTSIWVPCNATKFGNSLYEFRYRYQVNF